MEDFVPCCKCKKIPHLKYEAGDLWYVVCGCKKWYKYEFLSATKRSAVINWNTANRSMKHIGHKREE